MRGIYFLKIIGTICVACLPFAGIYAQSVTFKFTGAEQIYVVPDGVTSIAVDAQGAVGGSSSFSRGGYGGRVLCTLAVTPGTVLNLHVGGVGQNKTGLNATGGYNGGGMGQGNAGGGGGASDIRIGGDALSNRVLVAAGGGGGATNSLNRDYDRGGDGGGLTGENGYSYSSNSGVMGGLGGREIDWSKLPNFTIFKNGTLGNGGNGYDDDGNCGGGGGGYYGGCGGGAYIGSGGGGGSSYTDPMRAKAAVHTQGYNTEGDGEITITCLLSAATPSEEFPKRKRMAKEM
jgi:glycine rich protein